MGGAEDVPAHERREAKRDKRPSFARECVQKLEGSRGESAQIMVATPEAEIRTHEANLESGESRCEILSDKLRRTESDLKRAAARSGSDGAIGARCDEDGSGRFAPPSGKFISITYELYGIVSDRVSLAKNREAYASKAAEREELAQSMEREVEALNGVKRKCFTGAGPSNEVLSDIKDREARVKELTIRIAIVENCLEELRTRCPSIEDEETEGSKSNVFEGYGPALKILRNLNGSHLRTLLLHLMGCWFKSEFERRTLKEAIIRKDFSLGAFKNEVVAQDDKTSILSKALEHERESDSASVPYAHQVEKSRSELESSRLSKYRSVRASAEEDHNSKTGRIANGPDQPNAADMPNETAESLAQASNSNHEPGGGASDAKGGSEGPEAQDGPGGCAVDHACGGTVGTELTQTSTTSTAESPLATIVMPEDKPRDKDGGKDDDWWGGCDEKDGDRRVGGDKKGGDQWSDGEKKDVDWWNGGEGNDAIWWGGGVDEDDDRGVGGPPDSLRKEAYCAEAHRHCHYHPADVEKSKSEIIEVQLAQFSASYKEEMAHIRSETKALASRLKGASSQLDSASASRSRELENLRSELQSSALLEHGRARAAAEERCVSEIERVANHHNVSREARIEKVKAAMMATADSLQSKRLGQLATSHKEEMASREAEMDALASRLKEIRSRLESESAHHARDLEEMRSRLESSASPELRRVRAGAGARRVPDIERVAIDLDLSHAAGVKKLQLAMMVKAASQWEQLERLAKSHEEDVVRTNREMEALVSKLNDASSKLASVSRARELERMRSRLQRVQVAVDEKCISEIARITTDLDQAHVVDVEKVKLDILALIDSLQSKHLEELATAHEEVMVCKHSEIEVLAYQLKDTTSKLDSELACHARELEKLRSELESFALLNVQCEIGRVKIDLNSHVACIEKAKAATVDVTDSLQSRQPDQLIRGHEEDMPCMHSEAAVMASQLKASCSKFESESAAYVCELEKLRAELEPSALSKLPCIPDAARERYVCGIDHITIDLNQSHTDDAARTKSEMLVETDPFQREQLEWMAKSDQEAMALEVLASKLKDASLNWDRGRC